MSFIYESASGKISGKLVDTGTGLGIQPATLGVFIYDRDTETPLFGTASTPQNLTPVSTYVDADGDLLYYVPSSINLIQTAGKDREIHVARFVWTWTAQGATQTGKEEIEFEIINLSP